MKLPIKLICRTKRVHEDGTATVFIQYCYTTEQKTLLHTGIKIPPAYWKKMQCCISDKLPPAFGDHEALNNELRRQFRIAEDLVTHAIQTKIPDKGVFVKKTFSPALEISSVEEQVKEVANKEAEEKRSKLDIYYQFDEYIKSKQRKVSPATAVSIPFHIPGNSWGLHPREFPGSSACQKYPACIAGSPVAGPGHRS